MKATDSSELGNIETRQACAIVTVLSFALEGRPTAPTDLRNALQILQDERPWQALGYAAFRGLLRTEGNALRRRRAECAEAIAALTSAPAGGAAGLH